MTHSIPINIIGGYLGAGKTTLANNILRQNKNNQNPKRLAVLVNEFGTLPIDEDLIVKTNEKIISIAGGCVCCAYGDNLTTTLIELAKMNPPPDNILLEASGVAIPQNIAAAISLLQNFHIENIMIIIDALNIKTQYKNSFLTDTLQRQCKNADCIIINKCDCINKKQLTELKKWLDNKFAPKQIIQTTYSKIKNEFIFNNNKHILQNNNTPHNKNHIETFNFSPLPALDINAFTKYLQQTKHIIRAKGFVKNNKNQCYIIQLTNKQCEITQTQKNTKTQFVILAIKNKITKNDLEKIIKNCTI